MYTPQPAIVVKPSPFALYATLQVTGDIKKVLKQCANFQQRIDAVNALQPNANLKAALAFSPEFCQRADIAYPANLAPFREFGSGEIKAVKTPSDILLHVHSARHDLHFFVLRQWLSDIGSDVELLDETYGFCYLDERDMTGFIDGTENPQQDEDRQRVAIIADGAFAGGSAVLVQRYIHNLTAWDPISVAKQEQVIGRTKADSVELEHVPANSHVGRVDIKHEGKGVKIMRHSLPYGSVSGEHGLLFIAYCAHPENYELLLSNMFGERDGVIDNLLRFSKPVTGNYFYAPSLQQLLALQ